MDPKIWIPYVTAGMAVILIAVLARIESGKDTVLDEIMEAIAAICAAIVIIQILATDPTQRDLGPLWVLASAAIAPFTVRTGPHAIMWICRRRKIRRKRPTLVGQPPHAKV